MPFSFSPAECTLLFAPEYLRHFPDRGRPFRLPKLNLVFHGIRDCLCLGSASQALLPLHKDNQLPFIFKESCPYRATEFALPGIAASCLDAQVVEVDEAAPIFQTGAFNFWHWTMENLPKLLALESMGYAGKYILPHHEPVIARSLDMFGIAPERLLPSGVLYRVERLILPPRLSGFEMVENVSLVQFLRQSILDVTGTEKGNRRVYIRRIGKRKLTNEEEILPVLRDFGFETVTPEDLDHKEQFRFMTAVDCSVMVHGANSTLALFQKPRSIWVEMFNNRYVTYSNLHTVRAMKLRYHALVGDLELDSSPDTTTTVYAHLKAGMKSDVTIDPMYLRIILENALT
ncbi:MAG: glycosyltransferase family 61 protein [Deltaproteobacteria bacterium]|jgi:capsular polysaccharide biosynthesis protein|nr:glycosyltransferase family 61 protein [Deltaproteobacteria bacterium]